jgi:hypothetical protein
MMTIRQSILIFCLSLVVAACAQGAGLTWPTNHFLPTFPAPASTIDCIDISTAPNSQINLFASLEGIVNRTQPRLALVSSSAEEGEFTWMNLHNLAYTTINGFSAIQTYRSSVTGLVVTDTNQPDTLNLATTIAGVKNELICDPSLLATLTNAPYNLPVGDDLRGLFTNQYQVYHYLYTNYWPQCTHRIIAGMETNVAGNLRDYLIAVKAAVFWLDPGSSPDAAALAPFASGMAPVGGVYMGWWPSEGNGLEWIAQYGIPVIASDFFVNGSLFSGVTKTVTIPPIPPAPPLQNKVYVSITLSDGDNVQYMQHYLKVNWGNASRGRVPIGWTAQPLSLDLDPVMLNYYWSTASTNDCLVAGPSGAGYTRLNFWSLANVAAYTSASAPYLQASGMNAITVWLNVTRPMADLYAANCPSLLGLFDQSDGYYSTNYVSIPSLGFPSSANYASTAAAILAGITNTAASWSGSTPMFIAVQGSGWDISPADCLTIANTLNPSEYVVVRPDHMQMLYRQAAGLSESGAPRIIGNLPATMQVPASFPLTTTVYPVGAQPLACQWRFNGTNLTDGSRIAGSQTTRLSVFPASLGDLGQYQVVVTNASGAITSAVCAVTIGRDSLNAASGWIGNGNAGAVTNGAVTLTDGNGGEASSAFLYAAQYVGAFIASFTYQDVGGGGADGFAFVLQNALSGPSALGGSGGALGYQGISPSVALEFNIYSSYGVGMAIRTNGATGSPYASTGPVNVAGGHPIGVSLAYNGSSLSLTLTDSVSHVSFASNMALNIPGVLGTNIAYVGVTGADGGINSVQIVSNFVFASMVPLSSQSNGANAVELNWPNAAGGFVLQQTPILGQSWTTVSNIVTTDANGNNGEIMPASAPQTFYRLALP